MAFTCVMESQTPHTNETKKASTVRGTLIKTQSLQTVSESNDDDDTR
jgi:hypothetical protein